MAEKEQKDIENKSPNQAPLPLSNDYTNMADAPSLS